MTSSAGERRIISASLEVAAPPEWLFELIADPAQHPRLDGNDNLARAPQGQRVRAVGDVFTMTLTGGSVRENHVVDFAEGRRLGWMPAEPGQAPPGHRWQWDLEPVDDGRTWVTHTYDWSGLTDARRLAHARTTTAEDLHASLTRLADVAVADHRSSSRARTAQLVVNARSPQTLVRFWAEVVGGEPVHRARGWSHVDAPGSLRLAFQPAQVDGETGSRLHLDLRVDDLEVAVTHAVALGATTAGDVVSDDVGAYRVMRDPEGNVFCFVDG